MKKYDSHIHIGEYEQNKYLIENSEYRKKYKLYSAIDPRLIEMQQQYTEQLDDFFAIPLFFKETKIEDCNQYVIDYCKEKKKGIPTLLLDTNENFKGNYDIALFKEHFLMNDFLDWKDRSNYYEFLSENRGFLLIHCKDNVRIEYVKKLLSSFPKMNIIIAHLGRDTYEKPDFIAKVIDTFKDNERVLFDLSTIHNIENIMYAISKVGSSRILYGSDFPFEYKSLDEIELFREKLLDSLGNDENIFEKNFEDIKRRIYVNK